MKSPVCSHKYKVSKAVWGILLWLIGISLHFTDIAAGNDPAVPFARGLQVAGGVCGAVRLRLLLRLLRAARRRRRRQAHRRRRRHQDLHVPKLDAQGGSLTN